MTSAFQINDTLPKDSSGQKFLAAVIPGSITNFALIKGIGASNADSKQYSWAAHATHKKGETLGASSNVLVMGGGLWIESMTASAATQSGTPQSFSVSQYGELLVNSLKKDWSLSTASVETHLAASGALYGVIIAWDDVNSGNNVLIEDGDAAFTTFYFPSPSGTEKLFWEPNAPVKIATSIKHTLTIGGNGTASVTVAYTSW